MHFCWRYMGIKQVHMSESQMISDTMLLLTLSPVRGQPKSRDITTE